MGKVSTGLIGIFSGAISLFVSFFNYAGFEKFPVVIRLAAIILSALAIGVCQGFCVERLGHKAIGIGSFLGLLIPYAPVVVVSYGFALMYLPLLMVFAMVVFLGARIGAYLRIISRRSA